MLNKMSCCAALWLSSCASLWAKEAPEVFKGWRFETDVIKPSELNDFTELKRRAKWAFWRDHIVYDKKKAAKDLQRLKRYMEVEGFYDGRLSSSKVPVKNGVELQVALKEGRRCQVQEVVYQFDAREGLKDAYLAKFIELVPMTSGSDFSETQLQLSQEILLNALLNKGHYWASIKPTVQLHRKKGEAKVRFKVHVGPITRMGKTTIKGNEHIAEYLIRREFIHQQGDAFNMSHLMNSRHALVKTRWFSSVVMTPDPKAPEGSDHVNVVLKVVEAEPRTIGIGVGVGSEEGPRLKTRWKHRNFLKKGWQQSVGFEVSKLNLSIQSGLDIPYAFRKDGHLRFELNYGLDNEEDYEAWLGDLIGTWARPLGKSRWEMGATFKTQEHDSDGTLLSAIGDPSETALMLGPHMRLTRPIHLKKLDWKLEASISGLWMFDVGSKGSAFWRHGLGLKSEQAWPMDWKGLQRLRLGWMDAWQGGSVPVSERYYTGGSGKVRGYERRIIGPRSAAGDRLGGTSLAEASFEWQHGLVVENLIGAIFCDAGQLDLDWQGVQLSEFRLGVGAGVGYALPMGLMRLDIGIPLERRSWEAPFQIHFDFGAQL